MFFLTFLPLLLNPTPNPLPPRLSTILRKNRVLQTFKEISKFRGMNGVEGLNRSAVVNMYTNEDKTRTSFFNCNFFGDFKYDYDNNYTNDIIIMIMILIFECNHDFPTFHSQTLLLHCKGADYKRFYSVSERACQDLSIIYFTI